MLDSLKDLQSRFSNDLAEKIKEVPFVDTNEFQPLEIDANLKALLQLDLEFGFEKFSQLVEVAILDLFDKVAGTRLPDKVIEVRKQDLRALLFLKRQLQWLSAYGCRPSLNHLEG